MHVLIITPIYPPTTGGAATYYSLLSSGLLASGEVSQITIISERVPGHPKHELRDDGRLRIIRLFPHRAGHRLGRIALYWRYGIQNLQYAILPMLVSRLKPDIMLVHSSVHIYFNTLRPFIRYFSKRLPVVVDVRDHQIHISRLDQLDPYSALIVCSLNVKVHICHARSLAVKVTHIPVVQERIPNDRPNALQTLARYGVRHQGYFLFAGLIKQAKGVDLLLDVFDELRLGGVDADLVLAGLVKDDSLIDRARKMPGVRVIGAVARQELLDLMSGARMVVNMSTSEGMPRTSLEALALGVPVLLPSGIPEFDQYCPEAVVRSNRPQDVANQILALLAAPSDRQNYPITMHEIDAVLGSYIDLFRSLIDKKKHENKAS